MKKRIMAMFLAMIMVLSSLPAENVFATDTVAEFTYTVNDSKATITGYTDDTVSSLVIPETVGGYNVTAIADGAFSWDKYPNLTDFAVRGATVSIGEKICGFDSADSRNDNIVLWGIKGGTLETYAGSHLFDFKPVATTMTDIESEHDVKCCYTGVEFKVYTYISADNVDALEDIIWESENPDQVNITAFGTPVKQNDGTYKAEATVNILTKGDGTCNVYASARGLDSKKAMELVLKQSAKSVDVKVAIYTSPDEENTFEKLDTPATFYQNKTVTADAGTYLWISATPVGSDEDPLLIGKTATADDYIERVGTYNDGQNDGQLYRLIGTTGREYTHLTILSTSNMCSDKINIKIEQPATMINMTMNGEEVLEGSTYFVIEGEKVTLGAGLDPADSTDSVTWTSQNSNVATVVGGIVTTHKAGDAVLVCTVNDTDGAKRNLSTSFNLKVRLKILYNKLGISKTVNGEAIKELDIESGTSCKIYPIDLEPGDTEPNEPLIYTSSDSKIATVDQDGKITAVNNKTGTAVITASAARGDNTNATASVVVNTYIKATSISISSAEQIPQGQSKVVPYTLSPSGASEEISWTPTDSSVATVEDNGDGTITINALKVGNTTVEGRSKSGGATVSIQVVVQTPIHMTEMGIAVNDTTSYRKSYTDEDDITVYEVPKSGEIILSPAYKPNNANDGIKWYYDVDGEDIAIGIVDGSNLVVSAKKPGTQLFTLRNTNGLVAYCKVKVIVPATKLDICSGTSTSPVSTTTIGVNESYICNAQMGSNVTDICTWTANNDNVEINKITTANKESIQIKGLKTGTTIITATSESGEYVDQLEVVVNIPVTDITFVEDGEILTSGLNVLLNDEKEVVLNVTPVDTTAKSYNWESKYGNVTITPINNGSSAVIKGYSVGTDIITVTPEHGKAKTLSVKVLQPSESISFTCSETTINKGSTVTATATLNPVGANDGVTYTTDKDGIVSLVPSADGKNVTITGIGAGDVVITATTGSGKQDSITLKVVTVDASEFVVTGITATGYAYSGEEIKPSVTVKYNGLTLKKDTDYELRYDNNINVTEEAKVIITGIGKYSGTIEKIFKINPKVATSLSVSFVENNSTSISKTYNGIAYEPDIKILNGNVILIKGTDYKVTYPDNPVNVGKYSLNITYIGNYSGTKNISYNIVAKPISDSIISVSGINTLGYTYTGDAIKPSIVVKDGGSTLVAEKEGDYTLSYSNNTNASTDTQKGKITIKGVGNYSGTKVVEFTINPASIASVTATEIPDKTYSGSEQKPSVSLKFNDKSLASSNYTVSYSGITNAGRATVTITGKGNFTGTKNLYFKILPKQVTGVKQTKATKSSATLTWTKVEGGVSGYCIYKYNTKTKKYTYVAATSKNKYTVSKLSAGSDYAYVVCAYKSVGSDKYLGSYSAVCTVKTSTGKPSLTKAQSTSAGNVTLKWKKTKGATQYYVYYSANGKKFKLKTKTSATTVSISGLKSKKKHYFKIKAVRNINGKDYASAFSKVKNVKAK